MAADPIESVSSATHADASRRAGRKNVRLLETRLRHRRASQTTTRLSMGSHRSRASTSTSITTSASTAAEHEPPASFDNHHGEALDLARTDRSQLRRGPRAFIRRFKVQFEWFRFENAQVEVSTRAIHRPLQQGGLRARGGGRADSPRGRPKESDSSDHQPTSGERLRGQHQDSDWRTAPRFASKE